LTDKHAADLDKNHFLEFYFEALPNEPLSAPLVGPVPRYANYVIQKVIDLAGDAHLARIVASLGDQLPAVRRGAYGKHIVAKLERATGRRLVEGPVPRD